MAITQQLARVDDEALAECRRDVHRLDDLCSFRRLEDVDHLDLDWAPALLERVAVAADVPPDQLSALQLSTAGEAEVNPEYRNHPNSVWVQPVTFNSARCVAALQPLLERLAQNGFPSTDVVLESLETLPRSARPHDAPSYLASHFRTLHQFYAEAAARALCIVLWWD